MPALAPICRLRLAAALLVALALGACASTQERNELFEAQLEIAVEYLKQGDFVNSESLLRQAQSRRPTDARIFNAWGLWHQAQGNNDEAVTNFRRGLQQHPQDPLLNNNYGVLLHQQQQYSQAVVHFRRTVDSPIYPNRALAWENLGDSASADNAIELALEAYSSAYKLTPERWILLLKLAKAYSISNQPTRAYEHIQQYMSTLQRLNIKPSRSDLELGAAIAASNKEWLVVDRYQELIQELINE